MRVSNTIRSDVEQVIEDEKWDDSGHQTGEDRSRSKSAQEEQLKGIAPIRTSGMILAAIRITMNCCCL